MAGWKKILSQPSTADITVPDDTGTLALTSDLHTQGTDSGTTGGSFTIDNDSTTGKLQLAPGTAGTNHTVRIEAAQTTANLTLVLPSGGGSRNIASEQYVDAADDELSDAIDDLISDIDQTHQNLEGDITARLQLAGGTMTGILNPGGNSIYGTQEFTVGFSLESSADRTLTLSAANTNGDGYIQFLTDKIKESAVFRDEDDLDGAAPRNFAMASQASIKAYVDSAPFQYFFLKSGFNYAYTGGTLVYIPIGSAELARDASSPIGKSENIVWIAPFDGTLEKVQARSDSAGGSTVIGLHVSGSGVSTPTVVAQETKTVDMVLGRVTYNFTGWTTNTFDKGDIIMFSFDPTNDTNDTQIQITLKLDTST